MFIFFLHTFHVNGDKVCTRFSDLHSAKSTAGKNFCSNSGVMAVKVAQVGENGLNAKTRLVLRKNSYGTCVLRKED